MPITDKQAGLINAGAQLLGQGVNAMAQGSMNRKTRKWNEKMYAQQRKDALADWNMQNEYNSPQAQMQRLKMAGLNPNLVYENGATQNAGPIRSSNVENWSPKAPTFDMGSVAQTGLFSYLDAEMKKTQIDNLKTMNTVATQDAALRAAQIASTVAGTAKTMQDTEQGKFNLELATSMMPVTLETAKQSLRKITSETDIMLTQEERNKAMFSYGLKQAAENILNSRIQRARTKAEIDHINQQVENLKKDGTLKQLDINLKQNGIQPSDNIFLRVLSQVLNGTPFAESAKELIKKNFDSGQDYWYDEKGNRIPVPDYAK